MQEQVSMTAAIERMIPYYGIHRTPIKFYDLAAGVNFIGSIPSHLDEEPWLLDGLKCVMHEAGLKIGWKKGAQFFEKPVDVLDLIWDRFAQFGYESKRKKKG